MRLLFRKISLSPDTIQNGGQIFDMVNSVLLRRDLGTISNLTCLLIKNWSSVLRMLKSGLDAAVKSVMAMFKKAKDFFRSIWHWFLDCWNELWG